MKVWPLGAELLHADEQTETNMMKLIFTSRDLANEPKRDHVRYVR